VCVPRAPLPFWPRNEASRHTRARPRAPRRRRCGFRRRGRCVPESCYRRPALPHAVAAAFQAADAEVSPDGRHLYVADWDHGAGFNRLPLFDVGAGGSITTRAGAAVATQQGPHDIDFSPDGRSVYVAAGNQLVVLARDPSTGTLAQGQCFGAPPCFSATGQFSFNSVAVSPYSLRLRPGSTALAFDRNASTGTLARAQLPAAASPGSGAAVRERRRHRGQRLRDRGAHPTAARRAPRIRLRAVAVLTRAANEACLRSPPQEGDHGRDERGCRTVRHTRRLTQAWAANLDRRGACLVVSAAGRNTVFRRDQTNGRLTQTTASTGRNAS
jgi:DNA-binding beta-propeller fold protein YncE